MTRAATLIGWIACVGLAAACASGAGRGPTPASPRRAGASGHTAAATRTGQPSGSAHATATKSDPQRIARTVAADIGAGRIADAEAHFDAKMKALVPRSSLAAGTKALIAKVGAFRGLGAARSERRGDSAVVYHVPMKFQRATLDAAMKINSDGKVSFIHIGLGEEKTKPGGPPPYADNSRFHEVLISVGKPPKALPGTLTLPNGKGPFPAVVLVQGSGAHDRDETIGPNKPFRDLAWGLASRGVAVLRYDKRTKAYPGELLGHSFTIDDVITNDAVAAVALAKKQRKIDRHAVYLLGHSLGGTMAPRIAHRARAAGVIIMAGATRPLQKLIVDQAKYLLGLDGTISAADKKKIAAAKKLAATITAIQAGKPVPPGKLVFHASPAFWRSLGRYHPVASARTLNVPMLILQGGRDYQVTGKDLAGWRRGLAGHRHVTIVRYPALDHLFLAGHGPSTPSEYEVPSHVAKRVVVKIASWIKHTSRSQRGRI